jgi:hypothetical protein
VVIAVCGDRHGQFPVIPDSELVLLLITLSLKVGFRVLMTPTNQKHSSLSTLVRNLRSNFITPQFHFVADQQFETVMGCLNPSLKLNVTDPENIGMFLKTRWDTNDRDHALEHWDPEVDGEMPPLHQEWEQHPIDG